MFEKHYIDENSPGYPIGKIGHTSLIATKSKTELDTLSKDLKTELSKRSATIGSTDSIIIEDDADFLYARNVVQQAALQKLQDLKGTNATKQAELDKAYTESVIKRNEQRAASESSALFITPTAPPPNLADYTQKTVEGEGSTANTSKLTEAQLRKLEADSGEPVFNDKTMRLAEQSILANSKHQAVTVGGSGDTGVLVGNDATTTEINKLAAEIDAIETSRDACPNWMNCSLPGGDLLQKLKDKLGFLKGLNKLKQMLDKALKSIGEALGALLACPTHLAKKGLAGLRMLNNLGNTVSGMKNSNMSAVFLGSAIEGNGLTTLVSNPRGYMLDGMSGKQDSVSAKTLFNVFKACKAASPKFNFNALLSPFGLDDPKNNGVSGSGRDMNLYDTEYYTRVNGGGNSSTDPKALTQEQVARIHFLTEIMEQDRDIMLMQDRIAALRAAGKLPEEVASRGTPNSTVAMATGGSANVTSINTADIEASRTKTTGKMYRFETGDFSGADAEALMTEAEMRRLVAERANIKPVPITLHYRNEYRQAAAGYA